VEPAVEPSAAVAIGRTAWQRSAHELVSVALSVIALTRPWQWPIAGCTCTLN
jgi:hypothetical protein